MYVYQEDYKCAEKVPIVISIGLLNTRTFDLTQGTEAKKVVVHDQPAKYFKVTYITVCCFILII